jgi:hypothetical protein
MTESAFKFFMAFVDSPIRLKAIENSIGCISTRYRKPDQIIQPWQFGQPHSKGTCLWLYGLPFLEHTNVLDKPECGYWDNQTPSGQNKLGPSKERSKIRATTYPQVAAAMAEQWGKLSNQTETLKGYPHVS